MCALSGKSLTVSSVFFLCQVGNVFTSVRWLVVWFVSRIAQKQLDIFPRDLDGGCVSVRNKPQISLFRGLFSSMRWIWLYRVKTYAAAISAIIKSKDRSVCWLRASHEQHSGIYPWFYTHWGTQFQVTLTALIWVKKKKAVINPIYSTSFTQPTQHQRKQWTHWNMKNKNRDRVNNELIRGHKHDRK